MRRFAHSLFAMILGGGALVLMYANGAFVNPLGSLRHPLDIVAFFGIGMVAVLAGSRFPDVIEPGTSRGHRGMFHSKGMAFLLLGSILLTALMYTRWDPASPFVILFALGYLSHLFLDGLPFGKLPS